MGSTTDAPPRSRWSPVGRCGCRKPKRSWTRSLDASAVRYRLVVAAVAREGRRPRCRLADLLFAATAHVNDLDLYTRNDDDFSGPERLVRVIALSCSPGRVQGEP